MTQFGAQRFVEDLDELGLSPTVEAELVVFRFTPAAGARANTVVEVAVALDELASWPSSPPHWIYLPNDVRFDSHCEPSSRASWSRHSRRTDGWGRQPAPQDWLRHIEAVLKDAIE